MLPTELVGTYSCHGIDSNQDKINQVLHPLTSSDHPLSPLYLSPNPNPNPNPNTNPNPNPTPTPTPNPHPNP